MTGVPARVLLVEDDASIARFVALALEELPLELLVCERMEQAWELLQHTPVTLVISDLMLPGGSGLDLLRQLRASVQPALSQLPVIVLSAGLNADKLRELESAGVFRALLKPVSVVALESCVAEALELAATASPVAPALDKARPAAEVQAIAAYFAGDHQLFDDYQARCREQFVHDVAQGDWAARNADLQALRRLGHNIKSVLLSLGREQDSGLGGAMERAAQQGQTAEAAILWARLRECLLAG
jgi:DNA-binding response OmpR family regulator